jgi:predicted Zn-dependent peptidase
LSRLLPDTLPLLKELLRDAVYPESEIETWRTRQVQQLSVQQGKVSWLARTAFNREIYGSGHLYGYTTTADDLKAMTAGNIRESYRNGYNLGDAILVLSGKFTDATLDGINNVLGTIRSEPVQTSGQLPDLEPHTARTGIRKIRVDKADAVQSCIRIGKRLFPKSHADFIEMTVVSTILGGYFGSRLMTNIREDKGYTYGIGSALVPQVHGGVFFISTEVGCDVCDAALSEIYNELEHLSQVPVSEDELGLVRNYLIGSFQRSVDGPFGLADRFKAIKLHGLDYQYLERYQEVLHTIDGGTIMELTKKWLSPDSMTEVVAG